MTDHKSWLWRKKPSEKTIMVAEKVDHASSKYEEEIQVLLTDKAELEKDIRDLKDKLSNAIAECNDKDDLVIKHSKTAKEALAGWEKAEAKVLSLKQELEEALKERDISEERTRHMDAALKECMQQLRYVREDKEQRIHDVMLKASEELEETKMFFEEKLEESGEMIAKLTTEKSQIGKALLLKDELIEELNQQKAKVEDEVNALLERLEHLQKDNSSLLYEVRVLEKEVDIRNEEREFNRRSADASHKHHLENVKKIAKLESECQRLRVLVRKRLPGPAALAKMKSEVNMLDKNSANNRRKKSNLSTVNNMQLDYGVDGHPESPGRKMNLLNERICALEEENNTLLETLQQKTNELQISRNMYLQAASKLSRFEAQIEESHKIHSNRDARNVSLISNDLSLASMSDVGSDDKASCNGSWASKSVGMADINHYMEDFAEMEKLALVCVDKPIENSSNPNTESVGKELVPIASGEKLLPSVLSKSILKLIEMIQGIILPSEDSDPLKTPNRRNEDSYLVRVFQWRTSELSSVLQNFLHICDDLMNGKAEFEVFTQEMTLVLEWIMSHCFSLQDDSSMKDEIKKQLDWDETRSGSETEVTMSELSKLSRSNVSEEGRKVRNVGRDLGAEFECIYLRNQLQKSEDTITSLQSEIEDLRLSKTVIEEQYEYYKMTIEDLNSQLLAVNARMVEAHKDIGSLQAEMENKVNQYAELESRCLDLQVQLERTGKVDTKVRGNQDDKEVRSEWEISGASEKLAECQETILHLGKQLQAMASSRDAVASDKLISAPSRTAPDEATTPESETKLSSQRSSLLDQIRAEDSTENDHLESPKTKEMIYAKDTGSLSTGDSSTALDNEMALDSLAIVPSKKQHTTSGGLFKKLLRRKKQSNSKKMPLAFST
ncbi:Filament-like plant protein 7 [Bienertia sinuspersici]